LIQSPRDISIAFATMLLCTAFFTGHWWPMLLFAAVLFPWKFFGGIVEEHVLPWVRPRRSKKPDEWMCESELTDMREARM
jgi:hypothetical protein